MYGEERSALVDLLALYRVARSVPHKRALERRIRAHADYNDHLDQRN